MHKFLTDMSVGRQRGDTLVEVLIAIAVVSLVLGGAYVTTNRSLQATRAAQERAIALKLAESQIERLKSLMSTNSAAVMATSAPFCMSYVTGQPVNLPNDACDLNTDAVHAAEEPIFHLSIVRSSFDFVLTETWSNVNGKGTDKLQLRYRVYD